jgi:hypothetical protein
VGSLLGSLCKVVDVLMVDLASGWTKYVIFDSVLMIATG